MAFINPIKSFKNAADIGLLDTAAGVENAEFKKTSYIRAEFPPPIGLWCRNFETDAATIRSMLESIGEDVIDNLVKIA